MKRRSDIQIIEDKERAIFLYNQGYNMREIARVLNKENAAAGRDSISYGTVALDMQENLNDVRKAREEAGIKDLDELISRYEHLYKEALLSYQINPNAGLLNTASNVLEKIAKLRGVWIAKVELSQPTEMTDELNTKLKNEYKEFVKYKNKTK